MNNGQRGKSHCVATLKNGSLSAVIDGSRQVPAVSTPAFALPDFALAPYVASQSLRDGDTIRVRIFRCLPRSAGNPVELHDFVGAVSSGEAKRSGNPNAEPAWIVSGAASYPFKAVIAKQDGMVLRAETPQGRVGYSIDTYISSRP